MKLVSPLGDTMCFINDNGSNMAGEFGASQEFPKSRVLKAHLGGSQNYLVLALFELLSQTEHSHVWWTYMVLTFCNFEFQVLSLTTVAVSLRSWNL